MTVQVSINFVRPDDEAELHLAINAGRMAFVIRAFEDEMKAFRKKGHDTNAEFRLIDDTWTALFAQAGLQ